MSRIKIIERKQQIDEKMLTRYERQGLTLISVNTYTTKERAFPVEMWIPGMVTPLVDKIHWVYHFRIPAAENPPTHVSHGSGESSL